MMEKLKALVSTARKWIGKFLCYVSRPFSSEIGYFLTILILVGGPYILTYLLDLIRGVTTVSAIVPVVKVELDCFVLSYFFAMIYVVCRSVRDWLGTICKCIMLALFGLLAILDVGCLNALGASFCGDFVLLMRGTNPGEASEFFTFFFTPIVWLNIIVEMFILGGLIYCALKFSKFMNGHSHHKLWKWLKSVLWALLFLSYAYQAYLARNGAYAFLELGRRELIVDSIFYEYPELANPDPAIVAANPDSMPDNVILIIGESLSPYHLSIYGYDKNTTPELEKMVEDSTLIVFPGVKSPATSTNKSISKFMTTVGLSGDGREYYECETMPAILGKSGYRTFWLSAQNEKGMADNLVSSFAYLCDTHRFFSSGVDAISKGYETTYDECLIEPMIEEVDKGGKKFGVLHMMGQHEDFAARYPASRSKFNPSQYPELHTDFQRLVVSKYDDSVVYNDSVVGQIMHSFDDKEAIVFYLSDHSLDIYQSDPTSNYCGHALPGNEKSIAIATDIPFMVYMSPEYQANYPDVAARVRAAVGREFNAIDLIYTIMDVAGIRFSDNDNVASRSLFREKE